MPRPVLSRDGAWGQVLAPLPEQRLERSGRDRAKLATPGSARDCAQDAHHGRFASARARTALTIATEEEQGLAASSTRAREQAPGFPPLLRRDGAGLQESLEVRFPSYCRPLAPTAS